MLPAGLLGSRQPFIQKGNKERIIQKEVSGHSQLYNKILYVHVVGLVWFILLSFAYINFPDCVFF